MVANNRQYIWTIPARKKKSVIQESLVSVTRRASRTASPASHDGGLVLYEDSAHPPTTPSALRVQNACTAAPDAEIGYPVFGGESSDGGGDGYESARTFAPNAGGCAPGGVILICKPG